MALVNALLVIVVLSLCTSTEGVTVYYYAVGKCIDNYGELKSSILNNSENTEDLLKGFYPPNQSPSHVVTVRYYIQPIVNISDTADNTTNGTFSYDELNHTASYTYRWVDSSTLLLMDWKLFDALSFGIAKLSAVNISIIISPFCNKDDAVDLLNMATVWLKSYALNVEKEDRYYSLYFDGEKFVVLGSDIEKTSFALIVCEYFTIVISVITIYGLLIVSKFKLFRHIGVVISDISIPCVALMTYIIIKDIVSYNQAVDKTAQWYFAFPIPVVFPLCSVVNLIFSIVVVVINKEFPLPSLLRIAHFHCCFKNTLVKGILQVLLVFSLTSVAVLVGFHFIWLILAFSAYPVRSIASQAFIIPFLSISITIYFAVDVVANAPGLLRKMGNKLKRFAFSLLVGLLAVPFIVGLFGVLYYYSQALVEVNESENNPFKTVIAGLAPTAVAALVAWSGRRVLKTYTNVSGNNDDDAKDSQKEIDLKNLAGKDYLNKSNESNEDENMLDP